MQTHFQVCTVRLFVKAFFFLGTYTAIAVSRVRNIARSVRFSPTYNMFCLGRVRRGRHKEVNDSFRWVCRILSSILGTRKMFVNAIIGASRNDVSPRQQSGKKKKL